MKYFVTSLFIFFVLAASRFIPHPPNFTSLLALSFYVPAFLGRRYIPALILSFIVTDLIIGLHGITLFTWGSVLLVGLASRFFTITFFSRILGSLFGAGLFFIITNFGVWSLGNYAYNINGLINCYTLALPFFAYNLISTLVFASIIEAIYKIMLLKKISFVKNKFIHTYKFS